MTENFCFEAHMECARSITFILLSFGQLNRKNKFQKICGLIGINV